MTGIEHGWTSAASPDSSDVTPTNMNDHITSETDTSLVLSPDGAGGIEFRAESSGALILLEQHSASASTALDFTTCISSTYDEYQFELLNVIPTSNNNELYMRMSTDGGSTYASGGSDYATGGYAASSGGTAAYGGVGSAIVTRNSLEFSNSSVHGVNGVVRLFSPLNTSLDTHIVGTISYWTTTSVVSFVSGAYLATTAVDAFRFIFATGTVASGIIRAYGIVK